MTINKCDISIGNRQELQKYRTLCKQKRLERQQAALPQPQPANMSPIPASTALLAVSPYFSIRNRQELQEYSALCRQKRLERQQAALLHVQHVIASSTSPPATFAPSSSFPRPNTPTPFIAKTVDSSHLNNKIVQNPSQRTAAAPNIGTPLPFHHLSFNRAHSPSAALHLKSVDTSQESRDSSNNTVTSSSQKSTEVSTAAPTRTFFPSIEDNSPPHAATVVRDNHGLEAPIANSTDEIPFDQPPTNIERDDQGFDIASANSTGEISVEQQEADIQAQPLPLHAAHAPQLLDREENVELFVSSEDSESNGSQERGASSQQSIILLNERTSGSVTPTSSFSFPPTTHTQFSPMSLPRSVAASVHADDETNLEVVGFLVEEATGN